MYLITGGAGFIGSRLVRALNERGCANIIVVDDMTDGDKFTNLRSATIADYYDYRDFLEKIETGAFTQKITAIFHQGACTDTLERDGRYMMAVNYTFSKALFNYAVGLGIPFIYASSAAVYGGSGQFDESPVNERPLNVYGYSKLAFDQLVRSKLKAVSSQVVGLRYFNVYGPHEAHKGKMASTIFQFYQQLKSEGVIRLFGASHGYEDGEQRRDFVYVDDLVQLNLFLLDRGAASGIFNAGTGRSRSFNAVAKALVALAGRGEIQYIPFPETLTEHYQAFTEANLSRLSKKAGFREGMLTLEEGVERYWTFLQENDLGR
jgi:ADP-L-glycero-D-manno-heptose 6-epimerase